MATEAGQVTKEATSTVLVGEARIIKRIYQELILLNAERILLNKQTISLEQEVEDARSANQADQIRARRRFRLHKDRLLFNLKREEYLLRQERSIY
jgi:hypothetical protein